MIPYVITHAGRTSVEPFSNYLFEIFQDGRKVAELTHDFRGDDFCMRLPGGQWVAVSNRTLEGGGPQPLVLSLAGAKAVDRLLGYDR
jgi:hypothetical protein